MLGSFFMVGSPVRVTKNKTTDLVYGEMACLSGRALRATGWRVALWEGRPDRMAVEQRDSNGGCVRGDNVAAPRNTTLWRCLIAAQRWPGARTIGGAAKGPLTITHASN